MNQDPGPISHSRKPGADAEQETVEQFWQEHGAFALRHDYTNCLRVWDLSVFFPNGSRAIQEVKVKKSVSSSQKRKGRMVVELIKHHESTLSEGNLLIHQRRPSPESNGNVQTNLELLWQALLQAAQQSIGFAANTYLAIVVFDMTNPAKRPRDQLIQEWLQRTQSLIPSDIWPLHSVDVLRSTSRERVSYPCFGAPYTVYPLPSHIVARIVTGYLQVHYQLNTAAITQAFRDKGFEAECLLGEWRRQGLSQPKKTPEPYFRLRRGDATMTISRLTMEQITFEGLRLEDVIEAVIAADEERTRLAASPSRHHFGLLSTYTNMEQVWRTSRKVITPNAAGETESEECY